MAWLRWGEVPLETHVLPVVSLIVIRLGNEWKSYQSETAQQQIVHDRLAAKEGADEWDLQNAVSSTSLTPGAPTSLQCRS